MGAEVVEIFFSFLPEESKFYHKLRQQLSQPERDARIRCWSREDIIGGEEPASVIQKHLESAHLLVLLVSTSYLNADEYYQEALKAMAKYREHRAHILPVSLKPGLDGYKNTPFGNLKPANELPITLWDNQDEAFKAVAESIMQIVRQQQQPASSKNHNQFWTVPYPRNPYFTGREVELRAIHDALSAGQNAAIVQAISGLGGVGKTQLALEYAHRHREDYRYIFWVLADTRDTLNAEYSKIAELLDLPGKSQPEQRYIVAAVKNWLEKNTDWLLILDNADNLELFTSLTSEQEAFGGYLPVNAPGRILLTTRAHALGRLTRRIEIRKLDEEEGATFLLRRAGIIGENDALEKATPGDREIAQKLVRELDGLPLALDQAAAYIEETSCGLQGYLTRYQKQRKELLKMRGGLVNDHPQSVATTWQLAFERVEKADPAAADLLRLCAFLAPDDIPEMIITEGESELTGPLKKLARSPLKLDKAIAELQKYSLISRDLTTQTLSLHRLVQAVIRDAMTKNVERAWAVRVVRTMNRVFPWVEKIETWETCKQLLPHAQACVEVIEQWKMEMVEGAHLLHDVGSYLDDRGEYREAQKYCEKALAFYRKVLGEEHLFTANSMNSLANVYRNQGKYEKALAFYQQVLALRRKVLGDDHPDAASSLNNLATVYHAQGKYEQALVLHQQALAIQHKILREAHPDTATSLNNLAVVYHDQGNYEQALTLYQHALTLRRQALGDDHPDTASSLSNLALIYEKQGKYEDAEIWYKQSLAILQKILGGAHPDTASTVYNLSHLYKEQEKYEEAEALCKQALEIQRKMLGEAHPDTAYSLNNLGELYLAQGKDKEAETLFQQALVIRLKGLGEAHPYTAECQHNLAMLYKSQGKYEEALPLFEKALAIRQEKLLPEHADIKKTQEAYEETLQKLKEECDG